MQFVRFVENRTEFVILVRILNLFYHGVQLQILFHIIQFNYNLTKDKAKAKAELFECDLTELNNFDKDVKKIIEEIMAEDKTAETSKTKPQSTKTNKVVKNNDNE